MCLPRTWVIGQFSTNVRPPNASNALPNAGAYLLPRRRLCLGADPIRGNRAAKCEESSQIWRNGGRRKPGRKCDSKSSDRLKSPGKRLTTLWLRAIWNGERPGHAVWKVKSIPTLVFRPNHISAIMSGSLCEFYSLFWLPISMND